MQIYEYTVPELDRYRELCNFLDIETEYFNMKSRGNSNIQIAIELNVSEAQVSKIARRVKDKMNRVEKYTVFV